jgi:hypothetical protein
MLTAFIVVLGARPNRSRRRHGALDARAGSADMMAHGAAATDE